MKRVLLVFLVFLLCPFFTLATNSVELNTASLAQLEELTGVGPTIAQRIIDARPYSSVDDLAKVKGIGEKTLRDIKNQGLAYVSGQTSASVPVTSPTLDMTPTLQTSYPVGVIINEILPSPDGADETNEFIELYNVATADIDISGWKLQDIEGTQTTYTFPTNTKMRAGEYLLLTRAVTKILLNNDTDGIGLFWPNNRMIDMVNFTKAITKQSYNKTATGWQWSITPTPGTKNNITIPAIISKTKAKTLPKAKKTDNKVTMALGENSESVNPAIGALSGPLKNSNQNPWLLFTIAGLIALASGIVFLIITLILPKKDVRS